MVYKGFSRSLVLSLTLSSWLIKIRKDHEALVLLLLKMGLVVSYGIFYLLFTYFCFVLFFFRTMSAAQKALAAQPLYINSKYVELKLAQPKENISGVGKGLRNPELLKRTGSSSQSGGEFSGLATSYGRSGWKVTIEFC